MHKNDCGQNNNDIIMYVFMPTKKSSNNKKKEQSFKRSHEINKNHSNGVIFWFKDIRRSKK